MPKNKEKIICRCEEVTEEEIRNAIREGYTTIKAIKKRTRAGMGLCQGRTCSTLIRDIIAEMTGTKKKDILPDTVRPPLYPVELGVLGKKDKEKLILKNKISLFKQNTNPKNKRRRK